MWQRLVDAWDPPVAGRFMFVAGLMLFTGNAGVLPFLLGFALFIWFLHAVTD